METKTIHSLTDIQEETGESRHVINFLVRHHQIPLQIVGTTKILTEGGRRRLLKAIAAYRAKPDPAVAS